MTLARRFHSDRSTKGFSLVEILIACGLLAIILIPIFLVLSQAQSSVRLSTHEIEAWSIGSSFLEQARHLRAALLPPTSAPVEMQPAADGWVELSGPPGMNRINLPSWDGQLFSVHLTVDDLAMPATQDGIGRAGRLAVLVVSWKEGAGQSRQFEFPQVLIE